MADQPQTTETSETGAEAVLPQPDPPKPSETVDFWKGKAREQEKRAKENASAAQRLAEIEESQKSEAQKTADRIRELESAVQGAQREALRFKVASKFGIGDEDADLFLTGSDEDTLTRQAERLNGRSADRKKQGNYSPREGTATPPGSSSEQETVRALFGQG